MEAIMNMGKEQFEDMQLRSSWPEKLVTSEDALLGDEEDKYEEEEENIKMKRKKDCRQWLKKGEKIYYPEGELKTTSKIPAGIYDVNWDSKADSYYLQEKDIAVDELFILPSGEQKMILEDIRTFW